MKVYQSIESELTHRQTILATEYAYESSEYEFDEISVRNTNPVNISNKRFLD
jgi:hypothetical protein